MIKYYHFLITLIIIPSLYAADRFDGIAAVVGDSIILSSELEAYTFLKINQLGLKPDSLELDMMRHTSLDEIIEGKVLLVHAEKDTNISVSNEEVEAELNNRINYILQQNKITLTDFEKILNKEQGITLAKFKDEISQQIHQEVIKQKVQQFYIASKTVNRNDVIDFYNEYQDSLPELGESIKLAQVVINLTPSGEVQQKAYAKIISLKERLDNGEDFSEVATQYSEGPNAKGGGDLGFIAKGTLSELDFEEKIFSLKPGEISEPFRTRLGFHIVNILGRRDQQVHVRQIFASITPSEEEKIRANALLESIRNQSKSKEDFIVAVKKHSNDEVSKALDGELNWQSVNALSPLIRNAFDSLTIGSISTNVPSEDQITIYRINDIKKNRKLTLEDDWNEISRIAQRIFIQKKLINLVNKWQQEIYIDKRL